MIAILPDFLQERNGYNSQTASMMTSTIYFVAIPCIPILGRLADKFGLRIHRMLVATAVMLPFDLVMGLTTWNPIPFLIVCGICYSLVASSLWHSVWLVVQPETVGTANGICTSIQMIGIGCCNVIVGVLKDAFTYQEVFAMFSCVSTFAVITTIIAEMLDSTKSNFFLNIYIPQSTNIKKVELDEKKSLIVADSEEN